MHIKRMHEMIEKVTECANSQFAKGMDCVDTEEMEKVACIIKDLNEAEYYAKISKAMDDYAEEDIRYYDNYRYKNGRFAPKGRGTYQPRHYEEPMYYITPEMYKNNSPEYYRDIDRQSGNVMYYTESNNNSSRYDNAKRMYTEAKNKYSDTPDEKQKKMKHLEEYTKELTADVTGMLANMSPEEKTLLKTKMQTLLQHIV